MSVNEAGLLFVFLLCLATIAVWLVAGKVDRGTVYIRWLIILPSVLLVLLDGALLFTEFPFGNFELANLFSILIRIYTQVLFLAWGVIIVWSAVKKARRP